MKNILLLFCLFCLLISSCKEEENVHPNSACKEDEKVQSPITQLLQGTWEMPTLKDTYYDESDSLVYESVYELNAEVTFFGDSTRNSFPDENKHYFNVFSIYQKDGKDYLRVGSKCVGYGDSEIRTINETQLDLREDIRHNDVQYHDGTAWKKAKRRETIRFCTKK